MVYEEKMSISKVSKFLILSYTQNWKLGNLENLTVTSTFGSSYKSTLKNKLMQ